MSRTARHSRFAGWAWLLVAMVLLLRAAVPTGFMPERTDEGGISLTICGEGGVVHIPSTKDKAPKQDGAPSHCAFAGMGAPADLPPPLVLPSAAWSSHHFADRAEAAQRAAALYPRPPSRGPPILA
jgi:hypothetical protein